MKKQSGFSKALATILYLGILLCLILTARDTYSPEPSHSSLNSYSKAIQYSSKHFFEKNMGQTDKAVDYLYRDQNSMLYLLSSGSVLHSFNHDERQRCATVHMTLFESNPSSHGKGSGLLESKSNYFIGNEPDQWLSNVSHYERVEYADIYTNIDLVYYFNQNQIEFDFILKPGASPGNIGMMFSGADMCEKDEKGNLWLTTNGHELVYQKPIAWQHLKDGKENVDVEFVLLDKDKVGFELGHYDEKETLIIDPMVVYATYLGGSSYDYGAGIAVDSEGCVYVTGTTSSADFPIKNAFQPNRGLLGSQSDNDAFIAKFAAVGSHLIYSTYIGGWGGDNAVAIAVDNQGNAGITGYTASSNRSGTPEDDGLPLKNAYQTTLGGTTNQWDAFVTVLNANGSDLVYSTFLGGKYDDEGVDIAVDETGCLYIGGTTFSFDFPNRNAFMENISSYHFEAFATKLDPSRSGDASLIYSTFLGGNRDDYGTGIAVDQSGCAYLTGNTKSTDFPTTENPIQGQKNGTQDAFITKFSTDGKNVLYSTYLGGEYSDDIYDVEVDGAGSAYIYGAGIPTTPAAFTSGQSLCKLLPDGSGFIYANPVPAYARDFAVDDAGQVIFAGSKDNDVYVFAMDAAGYDSLYTYSIGGSGSDSAQDIVLDDEGNIYLTGRTQSTDFPVENAYQYNYGDDLTGFVKSDAFVMKLAPDVKRNLTVTPNPVIFPLTLPGETSEETVTVSNPSEEDIKIQNIDVEPPTLFALENNPDLPVTLESGEQVEFQVIYDPEGVGVSKTNPSAYLSGTGALVIVNDGENQILSVPLEAAGLIVNDTGDASDYDLFDGICDTDADEPGNQCTFRAAIENVNAMQDDNVTTVYIRIPGNGGSEIKPTKSLPAIEYPIRFDMQDQVLLNGEDAGTTDGLEIKSGHCFLSLFIFSHWKGNGLVINGGEWNYIEQCTFIHNAVEFNTPVAGLRIEESVSNRIRDNVFYGNVRYGIYLTGESSEDNIIEDCVIGYHRDGSLASENQETGIWFEKGVDNTIRNNIIGRNNFTGIDVNGAANTLIENNLIKENKVYGIRLSDSASDTEIRNNKIGCDQSGMEAVPNNTGILVFDGATDSNIHDNQISGNKHYGIKVGTNDGTGDGVSGTMIENNVIGLDGTGRKNLLNSTGIWLVGKVESTTIQSNTISGNGTYGIWINDTGKRLNEIVDNLIGTDVSGTQPVSNKGSGINVSKSSSVIIMGNTVSCNVIDQINLLDVTIGTVSIIDNKIGTDKNGSTMNYVHSNSYAAGLSSFKSNAYVTGNLIAHNPIGIECYSESNGYIAENKINHNQLGLKIEKSAVEVFMNDISENFEGIEIDDTGQHHVIIAGNAIYNNKLVNTGIHLYDADATIIGNNIYGDAGDGIINEGSGNPLINKNNIMDNEGFGIIHMGIAETINAQSNWWGSADGPGSAGPGSGDEVSAGVDFSGWRNQQISLFVAAENDTNILRIGFVVPVTLFFQNWTTPNDVVNYKIQSDQPWIYLYSENQVSLDNEWGGRGQALFGVPGGTPAGIMGHVEVSASSTIDGSVDTTRFVVVAGSMDLSVVSILPDSITISRGDTVQFTAKGYNQFSLEVAIDPLWACTGGSIDNSGQFIAGNTTGSFWVTATDAASGLVGQAQVIIVVDASVDDYANKIPEVYQLYPNYPNPFNPVTQIRYSIPEQTHVIVEVYNILGRKISTLVDHIQAPGQYATSWNGVDDNNNIVSGGIYICLIRTAQYQQSRKMLLIR